MPEIIVTVGPSSIDKKNIHRLKLAGADRFRINLSHSNKESLQKYFQILIEEGIQPSIDTQGAQLRIIDMSKNINLNLNQHIYLIFGLSNYEDYLNKNYILLNHFEAFEQIQIGDLMKVDFDGLALEIIKCVKSGVFIGEIVAQGYLKKNRAVDIQGKSLELNILTKFDEFALDYALSNNCKEIYASFVSNEQQVNYIRRKINPEIKVISKIENEAGVLRFREILKCSDEILIDRGDLSREISISAIPIVVMNLIKIAVEEEKPINIATNVLDSMMSSNIPSRAEISDIFRNLSDGVSGIVLAAEVAIGKNPVSSTALLKYLINTFINYKEGLHGIKKVAKPSPDLIGKELYNWL